MDLAAIVEDAAFVLDLANKAVNLAQDATPFIKAAYNIVVNKQPLTDDERKTLLIQEEALREMLNDDSIPEDQP